MMLAQGLEGAAVELHPHHIVIRRTGIINSMHGVGGEKSIPLSSITSVQFSDAGFFQAGFIRLSVIGETKPPRKERDPHKILFNGKNANAFRLLRDAVQDAINIPSLAALAVHHARERSDHARNLADASERDRSGMGRTASSNVLLLEHRGGASSIDADPDDIAPLDPTVSGWWTDLSLRMRVFLIGTLLFGAALFGFNPFRFLFGAIHPAVFWPSVVVTKLAVVMAGIALVARLLYVDNEHVVSRAKRVLKYCGVAIVLSVAVTFLMRSPSSASTEPAREMIIENAAAATDKGSAQAEPTEASALTASPNDWVGKYDGTFDGATGTLEITERPDRLLSISIGMGGAQCAGGIDAVVDQPAGDILTIVKAPYEDGDYQESACRLSLHRKGRDIRLDEVETCMNHHGMSCGFDGSAVRTRAR